MKTIRPQNNPFGHLAWILIASTLTPRPGAAEVIYEPYAFTTLAGKSEGSPSTTDGKRAAYWWYGIGSPRGGSPRTPDAMGSEARFSRPVAVAVDSAGTVYVADTDNHTIRKVTQAGAVTTLAGLAGVGGRVDGMGSVARFNRPVGVAVDTAGNIYVADSGSDTIRKVTISGVVTTLAGLAGTFGSEDGTGRTARFGSPYCYCVKPIESPLHIGPSDVAVRVQKRR